MSVNDRGSGRRGVPTTLKRARRRKPSSTRWLKRQLSDPYVAEARRLGYRSRAAFKLIELDDRFRFLNAGMRVIDLGAAPGGWTQVAAQRVGAAHGGSGRVVAIDLHPMDPIEGARFLEGDVEQADMLQAIRQAVGERADVVLSDMAPAASGHAGTDHLRIMALAEAAFAVARELLAPGGTFVCKVWQGGSEGELLAELKRNFARVRHAKPPASRSESAEMYVVATGFRG